VPESILNDYISYSYSQNLVTQYIDSDKFFCEVLHTSYHSNAEI